MKAPTPDTVYDEVEGAENWIAAHLAVTENITRRYTGPYFKNMIAAWTPDTENHEFSYLSLQVPRFILDNPRVSVLTDLGGSQRDVALALEAGANRWVNETNVRVPLTHIAFDMLVNWGVLMTGLERVNARGVLEGVGGEGKFGVPWRPYLERLPPDRVCWDPSATALEYRRWTAHKWVRDRDAILEEAKRNPRSGWNVEMIRSLAPNSGVESLNRDIANQESNLYEEIVGWDVWFKDIELPPNNPMWQGMSREQRAAHHGTIFTVLLPYYQRGVNRSANRAWARMPRPALCNENGPYTIIGAYPVQGTSVPLAPLVANKATIDELNDNVRAAGRSAREYKRLILVSDSDPDLANKLRETPHATVVPVRGLQAGQWAEVQIGGLDPGQVSYIQMLLERADRNTGVTETDRGRLDPNNTATAEGFAAAAAADRVAFLRNRYTDGCNEAIGNAIEYMYTNNRIVFPLGQGVADQLGMKPQSIQLPNGKVITIPPEPWFYGGRQTLGSGYTFKDLEAKIEADSMVRSSEARRQRRLMDGMAAITQIAPLMPAMPWVDWDDVNDMIGKSINWPGFANLFDTDLAAQIGKTQEAVAIREQHQAGKRQGAAAGNRLPRLSGDVGAGGLAKSIQLPGAGARPSPGGAGGALALPAQPKAGSSSARPTAKATTGAKR